MQLGHGNIVTSVAFSLDGKRVVSSSEDRTIRFWDISTGKEIAQFVGFRDGERFVITPEGYFNASPNGVKYLNVQIGNSIYLIINYYKEFLNPDYVTPVFQRKIRK